MIGTTIGNYVVKDKIGEGGMGVVYVAEHPRIGKKVAIKVLLPEYSQNVEVVSRFFTEAKASSAIKNDHIIDIIDFGELADKSSYIIMEWLEGEPLTTTLEREKKIPLERALHITRGIGRALAAAHRNGIVHRDLKPDNIFLVTRGDDTEFAKVLDFGIAKLLGNEGAGAPAIASKTRTGAIIGTPMYMSPEQCRGVAVDERSDIYSFAVIVYQMLVGKIPFEAEGLGDLLLKHMTEPPQPLRELDPTIPIGVEQAVLRALEKDPQKRFRRVEDFVSELGGQPTLAIETTRPTAPLTAPVTVLRGNAVGATDTIGAANGETFASTEPPKKRASFLYAVVPMALVAAVGIGYVVRQGKPTTPPPDPTPAARPGLATPSHPVESARPTEAAVPPPKQPAPSLVRLFVGATPSEAEILVDGQRKANPYTEDLPPDGHVYAVEIRAHGYTTHREQITLDQPRHLGVVLASERPEKPEKSAKGHKLPTPTPADVVAAKTETKTDAHATQPGNQPATKTDHPGADGKDEKGPTIYKGTKGKLITEDPYAKDPK